MAKDVEIRIVAKDGTSQTFRAVGTSAEQMGQKVERSGAMGSVSLTKMQAAAGAAGAALGALAVMTSKAAADAEASAARLRMSFENAGLGIDEYQDKINRLTDEGLRLAFDDEDVQDAIATLVTATGDAEEAFSDLAIAQDIARARGIDLAAATNIVIAAEQGRYGALKRMGIVLDETATSEEALAQLHERYAGNAEAYSETAAASWDRLGNAAENAMESVGGALNTVLMPLMALAVAGPQIAAFGSALAGLGGGAAGIAALGAALGTVAVATTALAAPVGILTYLVLDQDNVMRRAAESTLANKEALEGYLAYLDGLDTPPPAIPEMTQDMKELLYWVTELGKQLDTGLILAGPGLGQFATNLGALGDDLLRLSPENLQAVMDIAKNLGIDFLKPETWTPDNINIVANAIVQLGHEANNATYDALELSRAMNTNAESANLITDAFGDASFASQSLVAHLTAMNVAVSEDTWLMGELSKETANASTHIDNLGGRAAAAGVDMSGLTDEVLDLSRSLEDVGASALNRYMTMIVGFTDGVVNSIDKAKDWADSLIAPKGTYSELDNLLKNNKISLEQYNQAQQAQIDITDDYNRSAEYRNQIQAMQAPLIAQQADAAADYLETIAQMPEHEQAIALAWADQDMSGRVMQITEMGSQYSEMGSAGQAAFEDMVTGAANADPVLASVLESTGLIKKDLEGQWVVNIDAADGQSEVDTLVSTIQDLIDTLNDVYNLEVTTTFDDSSFWQAYNNLPNSKAINVYTTTQYGPSADVAIGGAQRFAKGGVVHLAELGPEMLRFPSGSTGMAYREGNYMIPDGTHVATADQTAHTMRSSGSGDVHMNGPFYITPGAGESSGMAAVNFARTVGGR